MDLATAIARHENPIVIVDDDFAPPNFDTVTPDARTAMFKSIRDDANKLATFANLLTTKETDPSALMAEVLPKSIDKLWEQYVAGVESDLLAPLFAEFAAKYRTNRSRVDALASILEATFKVKPLKFAKLEEAKPHLATCILAFVDFYLHGVFSVDDAHKTHAQAKEQLSAKFAYDTKTWPKIVVLVSSALPKHDGLADFRNATGIKSAFFQTLDKKNIESAFVESTLRRCMEQYLAATKLNSYLELVQLSVMEAAREINNEVSKLELHDLTMLKSLRLDAESESVQAYVTWLLSEAMASKLRASGPLQQPTLPAEADFAPLDGKLLPGSVLFELFTDIAIAPLPSDAATRVAFGDVLERVDAASPRGTRGLVLAISPACDLVRCELDHEVLTVHGTMADSSPSLQELLSKSYKFGKGHLVLKHVESNQQRFSRLQWNTKKVSTFAASTLQDATKFRRIARLSEVFAQEVKDLALSQLSRVGTPIDPSFSIALQAVVRVNIKVGQDVAPITFQSVPDEFDFVAAVLAMGRQPAPEDSEDKTLGKTVIFSRQFKEWLEGVLTKLNADHASNTKLKTIAEHFSKAESFHIALNGDSAAFAKGMIKVAFADTAPGGTARDFEINLFPFVRSEPSTAAETDGDGDAAVEVA